MQVLRQWEYGFYNATLLKSTSGKYIINFDGGKYYISCNLQDCNCIFEMYVRRFNGQNKAMVGVDYD